VPCYSSSTQARTARACTVRPAPHPAPPGAGFVRSTPIHSPRRYMRARSRWFRRNPCAARARAPHGGLCRAAHPARGGAQAHRITLLIPRKNRRHDGAPQLHRAAASPHHWARHADRPWLDSCRAHRVYSCSRSSDGSSGYFIGYDLCRCQRMGRVQDASCVADHEWLSSRSSADVRDLLQRNQRTARRPAHSHRDVRAIALCFTTPIPHM
jgi:hypothetical protein